MNFTIFTRILRVRQVMDPQVLAVAACNPGVTVLGLAPGDYTVIFLTPLEMPPRAVLIDRVEECKKAIMRRVRHALMSTQ